MNGRPYQATDFQPALDALGLMKDMKAFGSFQMNHVWIITMKSLAAKHRLLAAGEIQVKGKRCLVLDPNKTEVRVKLHWIPYHMPNHTIRAALEGYGRIEEISRETWRLPGFEGVETATRIVRLVLKDDVTVDRLPHQLRLDGCSELVVVPGC